MTLYELTGEMIELQEMLESGEYDEDMIRDTMEGVDGELEVKAENYAKCMRNMECDIASVKAEIDRLTVRKSSIEKGIERMKKALYEAMKATGKTKFKTELFSFGIRKNGGKQPMELIEGVEVPEDFQKIEWKTDTAAIRKALEEGQELPFARLKERGESLVIK